MTPKSSHRTSDVLELEDKGAEETLLLAPDQ